MKVFGKVIEKVGAKLGPKVGKAMLALNVKKPEILIGSGVLLMFGGTVMACLAMKKAEGILADRKSEIEDAKSVEAFDIRQANEYKDGEDQKEAIKEARKNAKTDIFIANLKCGWRLTKCFAPAVVAELAGACCIGSGNKEWRTRYGNAIAAYEVTDAAYRKLKEKHDNLLGDKKLLSEGTVEGEKAKEIGNPENGRSPFEPDPGRYSFCFDESCDIWRPNSNYNHDTARAIERTLNNMLHTRHYVFLNDLRTAFGCNSPGANAEGQIIGWATDMGDTEVCLNIPTHCIEDEYGFRSFWINPNCTHAILQSKHLNNR